MTRWGKGKARITHGASARSLLLQPSPPAGMAVRAEKTPQRVLEILRLLLQGERSKQAEEGEPYLKPTQKKCKSLPTNARLRERRLTPAVTLAAPLLALDREKAHFYHGCGCGIVRDTSIKCCPLKCHDVGFVPHFQLQTTADGRGRNNEDPFLTLSLKNLPVLFCQVGLLPPIPSMAFSTSCFGNYTHFSIYQTYS